MKDGRIDTEFTGDIFFSLKTDKLNEMGLRAIQIHRNYLESAIGLHKIREYEDNGNIELENFTFSYGKHTVLSIDCFAIPKESVTAVVGHN